MPEHVAQNGFQVGIVPPGWERDRLGHFCRGSGFMVHAPLSNLEYGQMLDRCQQQGVSVEVFARDCVLASMVRFETQAAA